MSNTEPKKLVLLGATGSIGSSTLRVLRAHKDKLKLVGVASQSRHEELAAICREFDVRHAVLGSESAYTLARKASNFPVGTQLSCGEVGLTELATLAGADIVLIAVVGAAGLRPALAAIEAGKDIALANKELLVLGGAYVIEAAKRKGIRLLPTDSEHNAIFQCLQGYSSEQVDKLILTASGGQFRNTPLKDLSDVTPDMATQHPNWSMGPKITVDSATMANKGLELIEAHWLFGLEPDRLEVVIHPQSIAHSFVQFIDGSILAQLCPPDMTFAIQHCLLFLTALTASRQALTPQSFLLDFTPPDFAKYPCLQLAYDALRAGNAVPAIYNAANEVAVERFLAREIRYLEISQIIEHCVTHIASPSCPSLDQLFQIDIETRDIAQKHNP